MSTIEEVQHQTRQEALEETAAPSTEIARIDAPLERRRVGDMAVDRWAGLTFNEYREAIEFSKIMAQARNSVPVYLKQNTGDCLAIVTQALRWRLEPYWVAQHSYVAKAESLIAYDAAVHAAIVLACGILKGRPRYSFAGEGEERTCTVSATFKGETEPHEYTTPILSRCRPPKNEQGTVKGSPLWTKDPDQQLGYYAMRNWGRRYCPEILGGVYDPEEFKDITQDATEIAPPASPKLMERLPGKMEGAGFQTDVVDAGLAEEAKQGTKPHKARQATQEAVQEVSKEPPPPETGPPPKAPEPPPPPPQEPKTAAEYGAYAEKWIKAITDADDAEARWDNDVDLRAALKVTVAERKKLEGLLKARIAKLRVGK